MTVAYGNDVVPNAICLINIFYTVCTRLHSNRQTHTCSLKCINQIHVSAKILLRSKVVKKHITMKSIDVVLVVNFEHIGN